MVKGHKSHFSLPHYSPPSSPFRVPYFRLAALGALLLTGTGAGLVTIFGLINFAGRAADLMCTSQSQVEMEQQMTTEPAGPAMCSLEEYDDGVWQLREGGVFESLEQLKSAYELSPGPMSIGWGNNGEMSDPELARILKAASYDWKPSSGCGIRPWDREAFIVKLLKAYSGLWLIGDSITDQHGMLMLSLLNLDDHLIWGNGDGIWFNGSHPRTREFLSKAGVPHSRLTRQLVRIKHKSWLLSKPDLVEMWKTVGVDDFHALDAWENERWEGVLDMAAEHEQSPDAYLYEKTILVMNSGAHWGPRQTGVLDLEKLSAGYKAFAQLLLDKLRPHSDQIDYYWRTTSPIHPGCEVTDNPNPLLAHYHGQSTNDSAKMDVVRAWGWDRIPEWNQIWRDRILKERAKGGKVGLIDPWKMANQRPDAHQAPPKDCLHLAPPTMAYQYTVMLAHALQTPPSLSGVTSYPPDLAGSATHTLSVTQTAALENALVPEIDLLN